MTERIGAGKGTLGLGVDRIIVRRHVIGLVPKVGELVLRML
jgi:hypothetical protein